MSECQEAEGAEGVSPGRSVFLYLPGHMEME